MPDERSCKSRDVVNVSILVLMALCLGIYIILSTTIIARDGVTFINYAKHLAIEPVVVMVDQDQHPGYPWLILKSHELFGTVSGDCSISSWIYCGQGTSLMFRLMSVAVVYFIGKHLIGAKLSFCAVMILIFLPGPAGYGSDVLSDWPHLFFLMLGILLLLKGSQTGRWWLFGFAGLASGGGYLIRPECVQVVLAGGLWLTLQLLWSKRVMSKSRVLLSMVLLVAGFIAFAGPYMNLKGKFFPKKDVGEFASHYQHRDEVVNEAAFSAVYTSQFFESKTVSAIGKLCENIAETFMWYFALPLVIVIRNHIGRRKWFSPDIFILTVLVLLNIAVMIWLYRGHGYMSNRHTLPLAVMLIFTVPVGLQELAVFLQGILSRKFKRSASDDNASRYLFVSFVAVGILICVPKLAVPMRIEKQGVLAAGQWLKDNTLSTDVIADPDSRISFYAERDSLVYYDGQIPLHTEYFVTISKGRSQASRPPGKLVYEYVGVSKGQVDVAVYKYLLE